MIWLDVTKTGDGSRHRSGLMRVTARLRAELGHTARPTAWPEIPRVNTADWYVTAELFSDLERPGFSAFVASRRCRTAAIFHDAIPLKWPQITWPQSVARHAGYLKTLASFERVFAVSQASADELKGFWRWQGVTAPPPVEVLPLGADFDATPRAVSRHPVRDDMPVIVCVGILEPRKNQSFLLRVCQSLWDEGLRFELHLVGRVNPHFGQSIVAEVKRLARADPRRCFWHRAVPDEALARLFARARVSVFPTIAEGCGLPLLESLWRGVPCVCSDLPVLRENADAGGCVPVRVNDGDAWTTTLRQALTDDLWIARLAEQALTRKLPTWAETAARLKLRLEA